jgi:hypothetical protein
MQMTSENFEFFFFSFNNYLEVFANNLDFCFLALIINTPPTQHPTSPKRWKYLCATHGLPLGHLR